MANNAIGNLMNNRNKIRQLMAMDANGDLDRIAESARNGGLLVSDGEGNVDFNAPDAKPTQPRQVVVNEQVMANHSKMPRAVLESFQNNPGKDAPLPSGLGGSVLDGIDIPVERKPQPRQAVKEQTQMVAPSAAPIDYSLLKTIINEAVQENVKKYMSALSKKLISEGVGGSAKTIKAIKLGESFSVITEDGDIYSCEPTFKRNIHETMKG